MRRRIFLILAIWATIAFTAQAQDGINLPADLYVLLNNGQIQRYGVGAAGVTTLTPQGLFIIDFGVDAQGRQIAFRTEDGLYSIDVAAGGTPQQLEGANADVPPYRGSGDTIAWSPRGDAIAYTTTYGARVLVPGGFVIELREGAFKGLSWSPGGSYLAAEAEANVWWIYRYENNTLILTSVVPSSVGTAWISDSELVFAPAEGGLRVMNMAQANAQAVLLDESVSYRLPQLNTEDALVFFGRDLNDASVPEGYGRLLMLARGAQQLQSIGQVPIALSGLRWAPGGSLLVAFQGGVIALYDPSTGLGFPLPMTEVVAYAWGVPGVTPPETGLATAVPNAAPTNAPADQPTSSAPTQAPALATPLPISTVNALTLSTDSFFLAPDFRGIVQVWRMRAGGTPPQPFTRSGSDVNEFSAAPDGLTVAYVVDAELWLQREGFQPALLARLNSFAPVEADFSTDSKSIAYIDERSGVWLDVIEEDAPQLVRANTDETYRRPQFSPDGNRLLLDVYSRNGISVGVFDLTTRELVQAPPAAPDDPRPVQTRWLRDGRIYTYVDASTPSSVAPGVYLLDSTAPGASPAQWLRLPDGVTVRASAEAVGGVLRLLTATGREAFAPLSVVDFELERGGMTTILDIGSVIAPQLSPDGRFVGGYESLTTIDGVQQGAILVVDLQTGRRFLLSNPAAAWGFRWALP